MITTNVSDNESINKMAKAMEDITIHYEPLLDKASRNYPIQKSLLKERQDEYDKAATEIIEQAKESDVNDLLVYTYWAAQMVRVRVIADALGVKPNSVAKTIGAGEFHLECERCGGEFFRVYKSRVDYTKDTETSMFVYRPMCDKCNKEFKLGQIYFDSIYEMLGYLATHPSSEAKGYSIRTHEHNGMQYSRYYSRDQVQQMIERAQEK